MNNKFVSSAHLVVEVLQA